MSIEKRAFGTLSDGRPAFLYTITNPKGASVNLTDYGASVVSAKVQDGKGQLRDIVLGCDCVEDYERQTACLGAVPGRHANRIGGGRFTLGGKEYHLAVKTAPTTCTAGRPAFTGGCGTGRLPTRRAWSFPISAPTGRRATRAT